MSIVSPTDTADTSSATSMHTLLNTPPRKRPFDSEDRHNHYYHDQEQQQQNQRQNDTFEFVSSVKRPRPLDSTLPSIRLISELGSKLWSSSPPAHNQCHHHHRCRAGRESVSDAAFRRPPSPDPSQSLSCITTFSTPISSGAPPASPLQSCNSLSAVTALATPTPSLLYSPEPNSSRERSRSLFSSLPSPPAAANTAYRGHRPGVGSYGNDSSTSCTPRNYSPSNAATPSHCGDPSSYRGCSTYPSVSAATTSHTAAVNSHPHDGDNNDDHRRRHVLEAGCSSDPPPTLGDVNGARLARNWSREETLSLVRAIGKYYNKLRQCKTNQERSSVWRQVHREHSQRFPGRSKKASQDRWGKVLSDYKDVMIHNKEKGAARWTFDFFDEVAAILRGTPGGDDLNAMVIPTTPMMPVKSADSPSSYHHHHTYHRGYHHQRAPSSETEDSESASANNAATSPRHRAPATATHAAPPIGSAIELQPSHHYSSHAQSNPSPPILPATHDSASSAHHHHHTQHSAPYLVDLLRKQISKMDAQIRAMDILRQNTLDVLRHVEATVSLSTMPQQSSPLSSSGPSQSRTHPINHHPHNYHHRHHSYGH